jgi:carbon-monoxide dehydrogenase large subunit
MGEGCYVGDLAIPGAAFVTFLTSSAAHAKIVNIDVSEARRAKGVLDVVTGADLDISPLPPPLPSLPEAMGRPILAVGAVRFVGEPVAAVVTETAAEGIDARELIDVEVEALPPVVDVEDALLDEVLVFPQAGTNVIASSTGGSEGADPSRCEVHLRARFRSHRVAVCPLETRAAAARWEINGRLTFWSSCQGAHPVRSVLCDLYGLAADQVRVVVPHVGGAFGAKTRPYPEELMLPWLARRVGRPVRWVPTRSEDMVGLGHARAQLQEVELGGGRDGTIESLFVRVVSDSGAYPVMGPMLSPTTGFMASGPYRIPEVGWQGSAVVTNTTPIVAYRGPGRAEASAMLERTVDLFANEIGLDPAVVRRKNFVRSFPHTSPTGCILDSGDYDSAFDAALAKVGYNELREEQARRRQAGATKQLGIGIATFADRTAGYVVAEYGGVELRADGGMLVRSGAVPSGQGHHTSWAMLVSERTGVPTERIDVICGDTDLVPRGSITGSSRSLQRSGSAIAIATDTLVDQARKLAADLLEAAVEDIVIDLASGGRFHVAGTPHHSLGWNDIASRHKDPLACETDFSSDMTFSFGAYIAVVEVDTETGKVELMRLVTVDDAGRILNPMLAEGQVHGGVAQGIAQILFEQFAHDRDGNPLTTNFADYGMPSAAELPPFESSLFESPTPNNPLGAKGIGESGAIGAPPAVLNAVIDALTPFAVRHLDPPCTPERVWRAIHDG